MKKLFLLSFAVVFSTVMFAADPPKKDIANVLSLNSSLSLGLDLVGENGIKGCVADFNGDGVDDFIITGLYNTPEPVTAKGFLRVYLGQKTGIPTMVYENLDFKIAGNGAIDCSKLADGSFLVALQGGSVGNWTNPFKGVVYKLKVNGSTATFSMLTELDYGAGRGSILFLDMNNDGFADLFQGGWAAVDNWPARTQIYINDKTDEWFDLEGFEAGTEPIRPGCNNFVVKGDLNNDGKTDIVQPIQGVGLFAYFNKGDKSFKEVLVTPFPKAERTDGMNIRSEDDATQAELIDFNGDGLLDIVMSATNDGTGGSWQYVLKLFVNNGNETFTEIAQTDFAENPITLLGGQRADIAVADFDLDGKQDIILGAENQNEAASWGCRTYFLRGNGKGGFEQTDITFDASTNAMGIVPMRRRGNFGRFLVGDFNGDGKKDLVTAGADYYGKNAGLRIYYNIANKTSINNIDKDAVVIYSAGNTITINGAKDTIAEIYSITGVLYQREMISNGNTSFQLNVVPGIYLVKVGSSVQKVFVK